MFFLYLVIAVAFMAALMVFITKATVGVMGKLGGETIYRLHESAEFILNTGLVPPFWRTKAEKRLRAAKERGAPQTTIIKIEKRIRRRYQKQMSKLLHFARNSSTVEDEETRDILVSGLETAARKWRESSLSDMSGT